MTERGTLAGVETSYFNLGLKRYSHVQGLCGADISLSFLLVPGTMHEITLASFQEKEGYGEYVEKAASLVLGNLNYQIQNWDSSEVPTRRLSAPLAIRQVCREVQAWVEAGEASQVELQIFEYLTERIASANEAQPFLTRFSESTRY